MIRKETKYIFISKKLKLIKQKQYILDAKEFKAITYCLNFYFNAKRGLKMNHFVEFVNKLRKKLK